MVERRIPTRAIDRLAEMEADFSGGVITGLSDTAGRVKHAKRADNAVFDRYRAIGVRGGTRDLIESTLAYEPHSLMMFYGTSGPRAFVAAGSRIYEISSVSGFVEQVLPTPTGPAYTSRRWSHTNINGALVATQEGSLEPPIAFDGTSWLSTSLPKPPAGMTVTPQAGGSVDVGSHQWRVRWIFRNGSSIAGDPVTAVMAASQKAHIAAVPQSTRSDYLGWSLERTKLTSATLWYVVSEFIDKTITVYDDGASDASLGTLRGAEPGNYAPPPHFEGVINFKDRLLGWFGTDLYCSMAVGDEGGAGVFNFNAQQRYPVHGGDGDDIVQCIEQADRLLIFKGQRLHALLGFDPPSFQIVTVPGATGTPSTRGATSHGVRVWWYGGFGRIFRLNGDRHDQVGKIEMGEYLDAMQPSDDATVVMGNDGERVLMGYRSSTDTFNRQVISYRIPFDHWEHHTELRINDLLVPKRNTLFNRARLFIADPKPVPPQGAADAALHPSFYVWNDNRSGTYQNYVQSLDFQGLERWPVNGILSSAADSSLSASGNVRCLGMPDGGCVVVGFEGRTPFGGFYAHRLSASGSHLWSGATGVTLYADVPSAFSDRVARICTDGGTGCIVAWSDLRSGPKNVYLQKLNSAGVPQWTANGLRVTGNGGFEEFAGLLPDGFGGCYVAWRYYTGSGTPQIRCQRVDASGVALWAAGGIAVSADSNRFFDRPAMCRASDGSLIFACEVTSGSLRAVRVLPTGVVAWTSSSLTPGSSGAALSSIVSDAAGGAILVYLEGAASKFRPFAVRVGPTGVAQWSGPIALVGDRVYGGATKPEDRYSIVEDGSGGCLIVIVPDVSPTAPVYVNRITREGALPWGPEVVAYSVTNERCYLPRITSDAAGGGILSFEVLGSLTAKAIRLASSGLALWGPKTVQSVANLLGYGGSSFQDAPEGSVPPITESGYHVWSAFDGYGDERAAGNEGGTETPWFVEFPDWDGGEPDVEKEFSRLFMLAELGTADLQASIAIDAGSTQAAIPISARGSGSRWGSNAVAPTPDTLIWNTGRWAKTRASEIVAPIPIGVVGKRARLALSAGLTDKLTLAAYVFDFNRLPDRGW